MKRILLMLLALSTASSTHPLSWETVKQYSQKYGTSIAQIGAGLSFLGLGAYGLYKSGYTEQALAGGLHLINNYVSKNSPTETLVSDNQIIRVPNATGTTITLTPVLSKGTTRQGYLINANGQIFKTGQTIKNLCVNGAEINVYENGINIQARNLDVVPNQSNARWNVPAKFYRNGDAIIVTNQPEQFKAPSIHDPLVTKVVAHPATIAGSTMLGSGLLWWGIYNFKKAYRSSSN